MATKNTDWKSVDLGKDLVDFSGARSAFLENDGNSFIALTLTLKSGRVVRIRKADYGVRVEEPSIPTITKYLVKTPEGMTKLCDNRGQADDIMHKFDGAEIEEIITPIEQPKLEVLDGCLF